MLFSTKNILESNNNSIYNEMMEDYDEFDVSYFGEALSIILDEQLVFESTLAYIEEGIAGSIVKHIATKQLDKIKNINIKELITKILDWFCQMFVKLSNAFLTGLYKFINANHRITMFKSKLKNFQGIVELPDNVEFFEFNIEDNSYSSFKIEIDKQYNDLIANLAKLKNAKNNMELENIVSDMIDSSNNLELDNIRGNSIGSNELISAADYSTALYDHFRKNYRHTSGSFFSGKIMIPNYDFKKYYDNYFNYSNLQKKIKAESKKIESDTKSLKSMIKNATTPTMFDYITDGSPLADNIKSQFNTVIANKCKNIQEICNIYLLFYSAKLDALRDYQKLCSRVLTRAIDAIIKEEGAKDGK